MKKIKIAYIGGGSKQWARVFMYDLALCNDFTGEIALYDIDIESAKVNQQIGGQINKSKETINQWNYVVYETLDKCLELADFVVISILPGTFEEMRSDVHAPEKYGIYQSVGDTAGPGAVLRAMRTVPYYEDYARSIEKICPNAWVINFTNPMSICTKTLFDVFPKIKAFGCCHEVFHTQDFICDVLKDATGVRPDRNEIYTEVSGINHFTWMTSAKYKNKDIFDYLPEYIVKHFENGHYEGGPDDAYKTNSFAYANIVKMDMFNRYGVLGAAGDRHLAEFMNCQWYLDSPEQVEKWKYALTTVDFRVNQMKERVQESIDLANGTKLVEVKKSNEEAIELMRAILGFSTKISNVNMVNEGQMPGIPIGSIVETNAIFTNDSVRPIMATKLPDGVLSLVSRSSYNIDVLYEGIKQRDLNIIFQSFINQPLCSKITIDQAKELYNTMIDNTKDYLEKNFDLSKRV